MSDRWIDDASKAGPGESEIARDLGTLARESHHEIPTLDESLDGYKGRFQAYTLDEDGNAIRLDSSGLVVASRIQMARLDPTV